MTGTSGLERGHLISLRSVQADGIPQRISQLGLVVSGQDYHNKTGGAVVTLITDHRIAYPFAVELPEGFAGRMVLSDYVRRCNFTKYDIQVIEAIPSRITHQVLGKLGSIITV